ncbi:MAG: tetratricopeptide repeat protein [Thermoanaerobaculia bacterium]|nr:tetratricopeptide repeat protein [Thermoanaerobaculia bacterium]
MTQVAELLPDNPDVHHQLAVAHHNEGRCELAADHLQKVVELAPDRVDPRVMLASIYLDQQRAPDALPLLRRALELAPDDPDAPWLLGRAQVLLGDLQAGIQTFEKAREMRPTSAVPAWAHNEWGNALAQSGRLYGALEHFEASLASEPDNAQTLFFLGLAHEARCGERGWPVSAYGRARCRTGVWQGHVVHHRQRPGVRDFPHRPHRLQW